MPIRRLVNQQYIRRLIYPGAQINTALQIIANDIINTELESATETGVRNIRKLKGYCRLRHGNYSNKDIKQEIDIQNIPDETAPISYQRDNSEESEIPENDIIDQEIYQENLKIEIENNLENIPEFEASGNSSNYFGEEIKSPENKSEIDEETEQELQGNEDYTEQTIEHAQILQVNDETAVSKRNDKKIEILDNIIIKHASKTNDGMLKTIIENVTAQDIKVVEIFKKNKILEANNEIVLKQTISYAKVEKITENTSTKTRKTEIVELATKENTEKAPQFNNFKVPKEVTHSKKKVVKKQQPRFVLTHVVGGYIIQESNFAFPIREPQSQKNKPQSSNTEVTVLPIEVKQEEKVIEEENGTKEPAPTEEDEKETVVKEESVTEPVPPTEMKEDVENEEFNPFARLQQSTVKSWTVEDVSNHLLKFNWEETAALLQDNEIDGASLFMVTKTQLMIIGVNEEQADVISEFVQFGSSREN